MKSASPFRRLAAASAVLAAASSAAFAETIRVPQDKGTIQAAVDAASAGDTVRVQHGTYPEHVVVSEKSDLRILASGRVTIDGTSTGTPLSISGCTEVVVRGFEIVNSIDHGVVVADSSLVDLSRLTIRNVAVNGVLLNQSSRVRCDRLRVEDTFDDGISTEGGVGNSDDCVFTKCRIRRCGEDAFDISGSRNRIAGNVVEDNESEAIQISGGTGTVVERNRISRSDNEGVQIDGDHTGAIVRDNRVDVSFSTGVLVNGAGARVERNRLKECDVGIEVESDGNFVSKNRVDRPRGEGIQVNGTDNDFVKNRVDRSDDDGFDVEASGNRFEKNVVRRAGDHGFEVNAGGNTFTKNQASRSTGFDLFDDSASGTNVYEKNRFRTIEIVAP